jgi:4'-phosphopantetheinyl transferase EntD
VTEALERAGLPCQRLPFDRPYHTPLFADFARRFEPLLARWVSSTPEAELYSCATAAPMPEDLTALRELACRQWTLPVRFQETIRAMYEAGVRLFVEVGPRGSLSAFVEAILAGRPHAAAPADVMGRSGLRQLHHLLALLAAHHVPMRLDPLYARRSPRRVDLDSPGDPYGPRPPVRQEWATTAGGPKDAAQAMETYFDTVTELLAAERERMRNYFLGPSGEPPPAADLAEPWPEAEALASREAVCVVHRAEADPQSRAAPDDRLLNDRERSLLAGLALSPQRRHEWLLGRAAAKSAVRSCLAGHLGLGSVGPTEIEIVPDERGAVTAHGVWEEQLGRPICVSISHTGALAAAIAGTDARVRKVGIDLERVGRMVPSAEESAFAPQERALLERFSHEEGSEWTLRAWCAKEAVGKALGCGLAADPRSLRVVALDPRTGALTVAARVPPDAARSRRVSRRLVAHTLRAGDLVLAVCVDMAPARPTPRTRGG